MKKKKQSKFNRMLDMPMEISSNKPKLTIVGFEELLIENYKGILEYEEFFIRINTYVGIININGFELELDEMTTDDLIIIGKIDSIDFEKSEE